MRTSLTVLSPPEAIIAVDKRVYNSTGRSKSFRTYNRTPPQGYVLEGPKDDYWIHWDPQALGIQAPAGAYARQHQTAFEAMLTQAQKHMDVKLLRNMSFEDIV